MDRFDIYECWPVFCRITDALNGSKYSRIAENVDRVAAKAVFEQWYLDNEENDDARLCLCRAGDAYIRPLSTDVLQDPAVLELDDADRKVALESTSLDDIPF